MPKNQFVLNCLVILIAISQLSGCAFGIRNPTLHYPPKSESGDIPEAHASVAQSPKNIKIILNTFTDNRSDKKVVGTVRNGFGMRTADVIPTNSVSEWVTQALQLELKNNGYEVISGKKDSYADKSTIVSGEILNVFCDMYFNYTGQVSLIAKVRKEGKELFNKHYAGEGSAGVAWAASEEAYAQSLSLALSSAIKEFLIDLDKNIASE